MTDEYIASVLAEAKDPLNQPVIPRFLDTWRAMIEIIENLKKDSSNR